MQISNTASMHGSQLFRDARTAVPVVRFLHQMERTAAAVDDVEDALADFAAATRRPVTHFTRLGTRERLRAHATGAAHTLSISEGTASPYRPPAPPFPFKHARYEARQ
ncbi:hypothetical protein MPL3356_110340 [Mesorhizobium plurifarium]|uniref:Uncharacterized protein n=1 Tax=Mesorhizobium plurifarium TaxID=69974 RepID=A0A090DAF1_MESPL|nr:hypothetical protein MPL3356_110340 [Mesorhizobium plurifarium]